jgi:hypothetical protein
MNEDVPNCVNYFFKEYAQKKGRLPCFILFLINLINKSKPEYLNMSSILSSHMHYANAIFNMSLKIFVILVYKWIFYWKKKILFKTKNDSCGFCFVLVLLVGNDRICMYNKINKFWFLSFFMTMIPIHHRIHWFFSSFLLMMKR